MLLQLNDKGKKRVCYLPAITAESQNFLKKHCAGQDMQQIKVKELLPTDLLFWFDADNKRYTTLAIEQDALLCRKNSPPFFLAVKTCTA
jgi:hypothetical protein